MLVIDFVCRACILQMGKEHGKQTGIDLIRKPVHNFSYFKDMKIILLSYIL